MLGCTALLQSQLNQLPPLPPLPPPDTSSSKAPSLLSPFPAATRWTLKLDAPLVTRPAFDAAAAYVPVVDKIVAYDLARGAPLWTATARPESPPVAGGGNLFFKDAGALIALHATDGSVAWQIPFADKLVAPLVWKDEWLLAATASTIHAVRALDGTIAWRHDTGSPIHGRPDLAGGGVFVPIEDGRVIALRLDDGTMTWERRLGGAPNDLVAADDQLFVGSMDNFLYSLMARNGRVDWRTRTGADVVSAPIVDDRRVYFVSLDNVLRAVNRGHGVQQWKRALPFRPAWGVMKAADTAVVAGLSGAGLAFYLRDGLPAGDMNLGAGVELAGPLYGFESPLALGPIIVGITQSARTGPTVTAFSRSIEPPMLPMLQPLPGIVPVGGSERRSGP